MQTNKEKTKQDYDFEWHCGNCDADDIKVKVDVNGKCHNCGAEYEWDFDCEYEDAVYIPIFKP